MIKPLLISSLETALNHYLSLDNDVSLFLAPMAGRIIAIEILPFNEMFFLCPTTDNIQLLESTTETVDARISGTLSALGFMGLNATPMRSIFNGEVTLEGDTHIAHKFQQLFEKLDIDLEERLSQFTGDVLAHKISNLFQKSFNWTKESITTFKLNSKEFLQEETRNLPAKAEADIFFQQVDKIQSDFDRLSTRIAELKLMINH